MGFKEYFNLFFENANVIMLIAMGISALICLFKKRFLAFISHFFEIAIAAFLYINVFRPFGYSENYSYETNVATLSGLALIGAAIINATNVGLFGDEPNLILFIVKLFLDVLLQLIAFLLLILVFGLMVAIARGDGMNILVAFLALGIFATPTSTILIIVVGD